MFRIWTKIFGREAEALRLAIKITLSHTIGFINNIRLVSGLRRHCWCNTSVMRKDWVMRHQGVHFTLSGAWDSEATLPLPLDEFSFLPEVIFMMVGVGGVRVLHIQKRKCLINALILNNTFFFFFCLLQVHCTVPSFTWLGSWLWTYYSSYKTKAGSWLWLELKDTD